mmetsp:Transcript_48943/g.116375  ORF Transcript_48943/g.116375 Transcript_48943/m.116375 type:complete len:105 (-) Transcript_48943:114-428(-)
MEARGYRGVRSVFARHCSQEASRRRKALASFHISPQQAQREFVLAIIVIAIIVCTAVMQQWWLAGISALMPWTCLACQRGWVLRNSTLQKLFSNCEIDSEAWLP